MLHSELEYKRQLRIGIISDVHVNPDYDPDIGSENQCKRSQVKNLKDQTVPKALLGRLGCDPPVSLVNTMF